MFDIKVNKVFRYGFTKLKCVADTYEYPDDKAGCPYCYFKNRTTCGLFKCEELERKDQIGIHFEEVEKSQKGFKR